MTASASDFVVKSCEIRHFGPHRAIPGRITGLVRVQIQELFLGNVTNYHLDLKVKADVGAVSTAEVRTALLAHAAHQLNKLKTRHTTKLAVAAE
ncbi:hypothetical protein [Devosia sp. FKR38]|uniref:hypothetical protein n=1 Tax=Devosia sp. FKR38 TaxID=2562312 RepID=UPI0010BF8ED4|nr:hypothetical protein [Devosia sp. FKR38]